jgi:protein-S-isoprenylcysteine O-methyltransferase Ste14
MKSIGARALAGLAGRTLLVAATLFLSAGTLDFWQAWIFLVAFLGPQALMGAYFLKVDPAFLARRLNRGPAAEGRTVQRVVMQLLGLFYVLMFLFSGCDRRFGWSHIPAPLVIVGDAMVVTGLFIQFLVFNANRFASATIAIHAEQKVISTGPYAIVRHPMYSGSLPVFFFAPIALGSWRALPFSFGLAAAIVFRLLDEEKLLRESLPGYPEYCQKVRHRLVPFVW